MRLGALVFARITHFGMAEKNEELVLRSNDDDISWFSVRMGKQADPFGDEDVARHVRIFLDDSVR
jgi:hypothetical protein